MKIENTETAGFSAAIRGMRNPMASYGRADSYVTGQGEFILGEKDKDLAQRLLSGGSPHDKFMRQIYVSADITAPLFLWKELDQYKVSTTTDSESTMHRLSSSPITIDCFEIDDYEPLIATNVHFHNNPEAIIEYCEDLRKMFIETKDKRYWKELIRWLPEGWLQKRTWSGSYAVVRNIVQQRRGHRLTEWNAIIDWSRTLPYANELIWYGIEDKHE